jgi:hypothetical protein
MGSRQCQIYGGPAKCFNGFHIPLDFQKRGQQDLINSLLSVMGCRE